MPRVTPASRKGSRLRLGVDGRVAALRQLDSPHCDERPDPADVSLLVLHNISLPPGEFGGPYIEQLFMGSLDCSAHPYFEGLRGLRVSAHLFISRRGRVTQFVPLQKRAWHAGKSSFEGRERCNDFSIGIELEGTDGRPFTASQYRKLVQLTRLILKAYPRITADRITGHSDIAPGRKTDPGPHFDWAGFKGQLAK